MKIFKLIVNLDDDGTGLTFNSLVEGPAHNKSLMTFDKSKKQTYFSFDDNKQMITGVAISANQLIERNNQELGQFYVYFEPSQIEKMILKMSKQQLLSSVNLEHDSNQIAKGVVFMEGYFVSETTRPPKSLDNQNIQLGSYVMTYFVEDKNLYNKIKDGKLAYSIEGLFEQIPINFNTNQKIKKMTKKKSIFQMIFGEEKFAEIEAKDGTKYTYDGELAVGTAMFVTVEDKQVAAAAGDVEMSDGTIITIDGDGLVSKITPKEEMSDEVTVDEVIEAMTKINKSVVALSERFTAFEKSLIKGEQKFQKSPKVKTWEDLTTKTK